MVTVAKPDALRLASRARENGAARTGPRTHTWDISGHCEDPRGVTVTGRDLAKPRGAWRWGEGGRMERVFRFSTHGNPVWVELRVPCRKCWACVRARTRSWVARAIKETANSRRTWMATLTFHPAEVARMRAIASRGVDWSKLTDPQRFRLLAREASEEVTKFLKRLRKTGAKARYLSVVEPHKSGVPHFHLLIHEISETQPVTHATLTGAWAKGFSRFKLVAQGEEARASFYVAKYLFKASMGARVRASIRYGDHALTAQPKA